MKIVVLSENYKCMYKIRARQVVHLLDVEKFVSLSAVKDVKLNVVVGKNMLGCCFVAFTVSRV